MVSSDLLAGALPSSCSIWSCTTAWLMLEALSVATPARRLVIAALALSSMDVHASLSPVSKACTMCSLHTTLEVFMSKVQGFRRVCQQKYTQLSVANLYSKALGY